MEVIALSHYWPHFARPEQLAPNGNWMIWMFLGGRGAGKTRAGAEWIRHKVRSGCKRIALIAPTYLDAREVMIDGQSGLCSIGFPSERPIFEVSRRRLVWPNGAVGHVFSAQDPDGLRGPQFDAAWADEFCAWAYPDDTLSNLRFGLRLGQNPKLVMTSTPRPLPFLRSLLSEKGVVTSHATTMSNAAYLSESFMDNIMDIYGGTTLGRQELMGEILDDVEGALWTISLLKRARLETVPFLNKKIVSIDPPVSSGPKADQCGIIVVGQGYSLDKNQRRHHAYVLEDASLQGLSPERWAKHAVKIMEKWDADYILIEINQGGEMVKSVFKAIGANIRIKTVRASKSKTARAEPVAALYEQGRVHHVGYFPLLEEELCAMGLPRANGGASRNASPDRADALVWAINDLLLDGENSPRIRMI